MKKKRKARSRESPVKNQICFHQGNQPVRAGDISITAGGTAYFKDYDFWQHDLIIPLVEVLLIPRALPYDIIVNGNIYPIPLTDFGGVPENWRDILEDAIKELRTARSPLVFCAGSHGRTGCFLGSLISILESAEKTPDPIAAVRERHCSHAVETREQAEAIFRLRNEQLPEMYVQEFTAREQAWLKYYQAQTKGGKR